ncbi:MAG: hypothetical protein U0Q11_15300 [Vicinamibacterales bacterium]|mgnify:FL=1
MKRLLVFALVATLGQASMAVAGESLLGSGTRHAQALAASAVVPASQEKTEALPAARTLAPAAAAYQGGSSTLSKSGMSKSKKAMIYIGLAVGFAASAWTIDHHVLDVTPSSLGTRKD